MWIHEYVILQVDGLWQVRFDSRLVSGQPTQMDALGVAQALAHAGALRGERSRIVVGDLDGGPMELPVTGPAVDVRRCRSGGPFKSATKSALRSTP